MTYMPEPARVVIMGAAGRDFHNFNMVYRGDRHSRVVAFTASQIPAIAGRCYPPSLAGDLYPEGIPIFDESGLADICRTQRIDQVVLAYSDISHAEVMHKASIALAAGADFVMLGPERTMIRAAVPVIAVCAVRTGCGKSQTTRWLSARLKRHGLRVAVIRHPMPYGDLEHQAVQRFAGQADLDAADCTIEEREEYEPHLALGNPVYAGVDYAEIVRRAEHEADVILWDGGNNDFAFLRPDLHIVLVDPLRAGAETSHHPGEAVLRMADIVLIAKSNSASSADLAEVRDNVRRIQPHARIIHGASPVLLDDATAVQGRRVLVVEDGPSITHGGMAYGAGYVAATEAHAAEIIDPREAAVGEIAAVYEMYPHIGRVLPAVGYHSAQLAALARTINRADADLVVSGTPCDLGDLIEIDKPIVRARYEYAEVEKPGLGESIDAFLAERGLC